MNSRVVLVLAICCLTPSFGAKLPFENGVRLESNRDVQRFSFPQRLDNFDNPIEAIWWSQSFYVNEEFSQGVANPPVFIYINGDWDTLEPTIFLERGLIYDYARNQSGTLISVDFRYNGASAPTPTLSQSNLRFYSTEQGIEDIAEFARALKTFIGFEESKVILYGGEYGGNIAIWSRQKYPELFAGAWGAAAPVAAQYDVDNFYRELGEVIRSVDQTCFEIFKVGLDQADELISNGETAEVTTTLNLCQDIYSQSDSTYFMFYYRFSEFLSLFVTNAARFLLEMTCNGINVPTLTELQRLGLFMRGTQNDTCFNINFPSFIVGLLNETPTNRARVALYQQCTEVGWFKSMNNEEDLFGDRLAATNVTVLCSAIFGINDEQIQQSVEEFNTKYGGQSPNVENVYFTNGDFSPMRFLGVQSDLNDLSPAVLIPDYGKLWEFFSLPASANPDIALNAAKQRGLDLISLWLS